MSDPAMRPSRVRPLALLLALGVLAGCQLALPGRGLLGSGGSSPETAPVTGVIAGEAIETTTLSAAPAAAPEAAIVPAAATTGATTPAATPAEAAATPATPPAAAAPVPQVSYPPELAPLAAECSRKKGHFAPRQPGSRSFTCFTLPKDAGRHCTKSSQCESACLATTQTCAPAAPLFGCHQVLTENGTAVTQCLN